MNKSKRTGSAILPTRLSGSACRPTRLLLIGSMSVLLVRVAIADDVLMLKVENNTEKVVAFTIWSERPVNPNRPKFVAEIKAGEVGKIPLQSPDRFLATVGYGTSVYKSKPMPLRKALAQNPNQTLKVSRLMAGTGPQVEEMLGLSLSPDDEDAEFADSMSEDDFESLNQRLEQTGPTPGRSLRRSRRR
jgi:hypothetical protein